MVYSISMVYIMAQAAATILVCYVASLVGKDGSFQILV